MSARHSRPRSTAETAPLIPRTLLFGHPQRSGPQLSPDGRRLAYLAPDDRGVLQVWLQGDAADGRDDRPLTRDPRRGIRIYNWAHLPDHLIYQQDSDGDENFHLYLLDVASGAVRDLTPFDGVRAELIALDHEQPDVMLAALNRADRRRMDVHRIDLRDGSIELDTPNPGTVLVWTAWHLEARAALAGADDGGHDLLLRDGRDRPWRTLRHWGPDEQGRPVGFSRDGRTLYLLGNHDSDTLRLLAHDIDAGTERVLAHDPTYDIDSVLTHPIEKTIQAVGIHRDKYEWQPLDDAVAADLAALAKIAAGREVHITSRDLADARWIVSLNSDHTMPHYHRYDRAAGGGAGSAAFLFAGNPQLDAYIGAPKQAIRVKARDGLTLHGYMTLPPGAGETNLPTVLYVHGGPWGRDGWGFWSVVQWLANRGYAVLQVNFRGSTGYGKAHLNAGNRQWAAAMHDDLVDAVHWAIERRIADPKRIAIMGASYGGYATLVGLTFTPQLFCAGIDLVGPSNLVTLLNTTPPWWHGMRAMLNHRVGDPDKDADDLRARSPLFRADRIQKPLLIGQGANDPRVRQAESDQIVAAMRRAGLPVQYVVYGDEGHSILRPENRLHFYALAEKFLAEHLGGRCEPADSDVVGHTGTLQ